MQRDLLDILGVWAVGRREVVASGGLGGGEKAVVPAGSKDCHVGPHIDSKYVGVWYMSRAFLEISIRHWGEGATWWCTKYPEWC